MPLPDASDILTYGAPKKNYEISVVDPETDLDATEYNKLACDVAMASRMVDRAEVQFTGGTAPTVVSFEAVWKSKTMTTPIVTRTATGVYAITLPTSVQDELLGSHNVNLKAASGSCAGATALHVQATADTNVITAYVFDMAGAPADGSGLRFVVRAR